MEFVTPRFRIDKINFNSIVVVGTGKVTWKVTCQKDSSPGNTFNSFYFIRFPDDVPSTKNFQITYISILLSHYV